VSAAALAGAAATLTDASRVFAEPVADRHASAIAALIDPAFLAEAGWDLATRVLYPPATHPLLGRPICRAAGCSTTAPDRSRICASCRRRLTEHGLGLDEVAALSVRQPSRLAQDADAGHGCAVAACTRPARHRDGVYCEAHQQRIRALRRREPDLDEQHWRVSEPAIGRGGEVSLRGLPQLLVAQVLFGLQQRCRINAVKTKEAVLRALCDDLRRQQVRSLGEYVVADSRDLEFKGLASGMAVHAGRALSTPESEVGKDEWNLVVFGHSGTVSFIGISQPWLREAAKRWAADDLPRRRVRPGRRTSVGLTVRHHIGCLVRLSESLRMRPDRGEHPAALGRADMQAFLHRLAFLESVGQISGDARIRACREVRAVLSHTRAAGLTRPGGIAAGLGDDFVITVADIPLKPEPAEPDRDLPPEIMRQLCAQLDQLPSPVMRTAVELAIDTGRRPEEICELDFDCLTRDEDGAPVLIYDNHKANRPGRRLPISEHTATLITAQQQRVRARFTDTPLGELKLLPTDRRNPGGRRGITGFSLAFAHRVWVERLGVLRTTDGIEYDKTKIVLYAYRHSYAQRHADAGVPVEVLRELMSHRKLETTSGYYRVGETRRREAVDRVAAMQFDRHGNRIWRQAQALLDSEYARRAVGEVAVPFGVCAEPSNVKAGGGACPFRFRCAGCDHFRTDVSYLPDLHAYLDDLLRTRERLLATTELDEWARAEAIPSEDEITRIRRLITRISSGLDELAADQREHVQQAVATLRRHRSVMLGMPRVRQALPDLRPERTA
jgi:integrase